MRVFQPQRGGMFIGVEQQKIPSSVRSGMGAGNAAPMGLFSFFGRCYKHSAPNGAGAALCFGAGAKARRAFANLPSALGASPSPRNGSRGEAVRLICLFMGRELVLSSILSLYQQVS